MSILVVGSIALDSVKTPFGEATEILGGSATYFSVAASFFANVNLVGVVGEDFQDEHINLLKRRSIDLQGLQKVKGKTFRWKGEYHYDLNTAITLDTQLNVFETFSPQIPKKYIESPFVFLANIDPELQLQVLKQIISPKLVVADTMNFWIERKKEALIETLKAVDVAVLNDGEARQLTKEPNLVKAAKQVLSWGPKWIIIKKGEHGCILFSDLAIFSAPAYPLEFIFDPTGAGDIFAGGFVGYLASRLSLEEKEMRKAIIYGSTLASFGVEDFGLKRLTILRNDEIKGRYRQFKEIAHFEDI